MRNGVLVTVLAAVVLAGGCADDHPAAAPEAVTTPTPTPSYDATQQPAVAVLALVPEEVQTVTVTDFEQVRAQLGADGLTDQSAPDEVASFWERASQERPLLTPGMLRGADARLLQEYGFTQLDVAWEAHLYDGDDQGAGWVLRFRDGTDMAQVAAAAADPSTPLSGGTVDAAEQLVTSGTTDDPEQSWAADPSTADLAGPAANSTYLSRACDDRGTGVDLDQLGTWSVQFEGSLVTARLGSGREDLFTRMRLGQGEPSFAAAYDGGVADPSTGRIGYVMSDPVAAAELALQHQLPFAACG